MVGEGWWLEGVDYVLVGIIWIVGIDEKSCFGGIFSWFVFEC